ncbi:IKI3 family-domain-containing protein [Lipomyces tetrasporus]|uniref:Elongator complex protein 1 n=1 Tax=Lipomyces tetrasporus TaxID=54092 RepID=A0AAD7QS69_9ASCO|nr:IKI3 family-domain-containing protein [Lipomyces tetrasporus]KAJ8100380.1 IKI3 family-domain-containing protein [Lipomyces tetrasporus]
MWNLLPIQRSPITVQSVSAPDLPLSGCFFDVVNDALICAFGPSRAVLHIELQEISKTGKIEVLASWDSLPVASDFDQIIDLHYFPDASTAVVVLAGGDIVSVRVKDNDQPEGIIEIVGSIDEGITSAAWSPDEEILAVTTGAQTIILLNRQFDPLVERKLVADDLKISRHVSVGWGKKETQFEGKGVKGMRDPTIPERVDDGVRSTADDGKVRISWRGDGAFVCVNSVDAVDLESLQLLRRTIRVYSREGVLESVSEPVDGQESFVSWRPSGNLIASVQRVPDGGECRVDVIFFERNGLRRHEFTTRLPPDECILDLQWNVESSVLAILLSNRIQLWTMSNYYWYLKQEVYVCGEDELAFMKWHPERPLTMILGHENKLEIHEFAWNLFSGSKSPPNDLGVLMVANGSELKITPLGIANTPPPMSFRDLALSETPIQAAINSANDIIAVLEHSMIELAEWSLLTPSSVKLPKVTKSIALASIDPAGAARQLRFINRQTLAVIFDHQGYSRIVILRLDSELQHDIIYVEDFDISVVTMAPRTDHRAIGVELANADIRQISIVSNGSDIGEIASENIGRLPERCLTIAEAIVKDRVIVFGLASNGRLYANQQRLSVSCTSFIVTENHLAFTTAQSLLKFVHLTDNEFEFEVPADSAVSVDERCRSIERGARIVAIIPSKVSMVLQMPRGNLETIFPRLLVLEGVRRSIDKKDYLQAFLACRAHRVNLDILYDYNPDLFMRNVELFVSSLRKVEYLDLFISGLTNEDVTRTIYKETLPSALISNKLSSLSLEDGVPAEVGSDGKSKVNRICDAILEILQKSYSKTHIQSIITAYLCKDPADIESALILIANFGHDNQDELASAIEHICFLQDVNKLYDYALGLYDLRLALLIARQSQKDPREYLPFIDNLQKHVPLRRRFLLDTHLGRYDKALVHLCDLKYDEQGNDVFSEVEKYVVSHNLYKNAMKIYKYEPIKQYAILKLFAKHLKSHNEFKEAGLAYELLGDYADALDSYVLGSHWREALALCSMARLPRDEVQVISQKLAEVLYESRMYKDAATVYLEYRRDLKEAVRCLCKGYFYDEAIRIVLQQNSSDYLEEIVNPALIEGFNQITELLSDCRGQLSAQLERLRELRLKKSNDPMSYFEGPEESDVPDNVSIAPSELSTSASLFTRYTGKTGGTAQTGATRRTAKNRRREERKRARGKKGSIYEEEYLVNSIRRLIERVNETKDDGRRLIEGLSRREMHERAVEVQRRYVEMVNNIKSCVVEVFTISDRDRQRYDDDGNLYLLPEQPIPKVEEFEKLSILDYN